MILPQEVPHVDGGIIAGAEKDSTRLGQSAGGEGGVNCRGLVQGNFLKGDLSP